MSARAATWLAWSMCALSLALAAFSLLLLYLNYYSHPGVPIWGYWMPNTLITVGFSTVGAIIAPRLPPDNPIGWVFCTIGLLIGVTHGWGGEGDDAASPRLAVAAPRYAPEG
jgi:uncharacterized membrane protein YfcA